MLTLHQPRHVLGRDTGIEPILVPRSPGRNRTYELDALTVRCDMPTIAPDEC